MSDVQIIEAIEFGSGSATERYVVGRPFRDGEAPVKGIGESQPKGPGDVWMYNVIFEDGSAVRVFNQTRVFFGKPRKEIIKPRQKLIVE